MAGSAIPMLGVVAAIAVAPQTSLDDTPQQVVAEAITLTPVSPPATSGHFWHAETLRRGDSINRLLSRLNIRDSPAQRDILSGGAGRLLTQLKPGQTVSALVSESGRLISLRFTDPQGREAVVSREEDGLRFSLETPQLITTPELKSGVIHSSLFAATDKANLPDSVAVQLIDIFGSQIDFHRDLQRGDRFTVVYESLRNSQGEAVQTGKILAAEFINDGKLYRAVYYAPHGNSKGGYYSADGKSLKEAFLRSPLEFSRISSGFTIARFHPVLQQWRAHKGVDYAAPIGTKVKATADGTVEYVGQQNGYGNVIVVKHNEKYSTLYGHLSAFASGVRRGARIAQGEVIGHVGMTGWATGPHLHYELKVNGIQQDPLKVALPGALPLDAKNLASFRQTANEMMHRLTLLRDTNLARFD